MIIVLPAMWEMENMEKGAQHTSLTSASMGRPCCGRGEGEVRKEGAPPTWKCQEVFKEACP